MSIKGYWGIQIAYPACENQRIWGNLCPLHWIFNEQNVKCK